MYIVVVIDDNIINMIITGKLYTNVIPTGRKRGRNVVTLVERIE